jgi:acetate kinase
LDGLIFTAGIGENAPEIRAMVGLAGLAPNLMWSQTPGTLLS